MAAAYSSPYHARGRRSADWLAHLERSFADPAYALPGGAGYGDQQRAVALARYDESVGFAFWRAMSMPAVLPLELSAAAG